MRHSRRAMVALGGLSLLVSLSTAAVGAGVKARKAREGLNRAALVMIGKCLQDYLDEVRKQEVPERFKLLLRQF